MLLGVRAKSNKQKMCSVSVFMNYFDNPGGMIPTRLVNWAAKVGSHTLFKYIRLHYGQLGEGGSYWERVAQTGRGWLELGEGDSTGNERVKLGLGGSNWEAIGLVQSKLWSTAAFNPLSLFT